MTDTELQQVKQRFGIIGTEAALNRAIRVTVQVAPTDLAVLITGESGAGKENFPKIIHFYSHRKHGQYIAVNCGAIPEGTIDSELFGHEKGSFTGAVADRKGYFEVANGGTIFLDEVGELPLTTQVRLLRVLESGEFIKVGASKVQKTNVRVVAATNMDMAKAIAERRFREDLFYRLNSVPVHIPPLRERGNDIALLFRKFANDFAEKYRMPAIRLTDDAMQILTDYSWPGNVRQLKNITEQISVLEQNREISKEKLSEYLPANSPAEYLPVLFNSSHAKERTFDNEREILYQVLFDMRKDINDLKKLVHGAIGKENVNIPDVDDIYSPEYTSSSSIIIPSVSPINKMKNDDIQDTEEYVEERFSLEEVEKEMIRKALERNQNRRKYAAQELEISERTLYRKIKEYGL